MELCTTIKRHLPPSDFCGHLTLLFTAVTLVLEPAVLVFQAKKSDGNVRLMYGILGNPQT